jgi:hypothetical protein
MKIPSSQDFNISGFGKSYAYCTIYLFLLISAIYPIGCVLDFDHPANGGWQGSPPRTPPCPDNPGYSCPKYFRYFIKKISHSRPPSKPVGGKIWVDVIAVLWIGIVLNADPETNPTFYFDAVQIFCSLLFFIIPVPGILFYHSHQRHRSGITFNILDHILKFSAKKKYRTVQYR